MSLISPAPLLLDVQNFVPMVLLDRKNVLLSRQGVTINDARRFLRSGRNIGAVISKGLNPSNSSHSRLTAITNPLKHVGKGRHVPNFEDMSPLEQAMRSIPARLFRGGSSVENLNRKGAHRTVLARIFPTGALDYDATADQIAEVNTASGTIKTVSANQTVDSRGRGLLPTVPWDRHAKTTTGDFGDEHFVRPAPYIYKTDDFVDPQKKAPKVQASSPNDNYTRVADISAAHINYQLNSGLITPAKTIGSNTSHGRDFGSNSKKRKGIVHDGRKRIDIRRGVEERVTGGGMSDDVPFLPRTNSSKFGRRGRRGFRSHADIGSSDSGSVDTPPPLKRHRGHPGGGRFGIGDPTPAADTAGGSLSPSGEFLVDAPPSNPFPDAARDGSITQPALPGGPDGAPAWDFHTLPNYSPVHFPGGLPGPVVNPDELTSTHIPNFGQDTTAADQIESDGINWSKVEKDTSAEAGEMFSNALEHEVSGVFGGALGEFGLGGSEKKIAGGIEGAAKAAWQWVRDNTNYNTLP